MAQIWPDVSDAINNVVWDNSSQTFRFRWAFVTFSGETQDKAQVRWRKAGLAGLTPRQISQMGDDIWPAANYATVGRLDSSITSGFNVTAIDFPVGSLSPGVWIFQVNFWQTGATDWSGWTGAHRVEITPYGERQAYSGAATTVVKGPHAQVEGQYGARVEVVSEAGITNVLPTESVFNVWETNRYMKMPNGDLKAVPEHRHSGTIIGRVERTT